MEWDGSCALAGGDGRAEEEGTSLWDPQDGVSALHLLPSGPRRRSRAVTWAGQGLLALSVVWGSGAVSSGEGGAEAVEARRPCGEGAVVPWGKHSGARLGSTAAQWRQFL